MLKKIRASMVFAVLAALLILTFTSASGEAYPEVIPLPLGLQPEGIAAGNGNTFYTGELIGGTIIRGDLRTGEIEILTEYSDRAALGMDFDSRSGLLFVAGGPTGAAFIYDGDSGADAGMYQLAPMGTFVNDVIVTRTAAYFTNSFLPEIYRLPLGPRGSLPDPADVETIPLSGDFQFIPGGFNANGIEALQDGSALIVINSGVGELYRVDPGTGVASLIDLGGETLVNGDGLALRGLELYVVQNFFNRIAVVELDQTLSSGEITGYLTDSDFRIPTTAALFGDALYAVNARFDQVAPGSAQPSDEFEAVRVEID